MIIIEGLTARQIAVIRSSLSYFVNDVEEMDLVSSSHSFTSSESLKLLSLIAHECEAKATGTVEDLVEYCSEVCSMLECPRITDTGITLELDEELACILLAIFNYLCEDDAELNALVTFRGEYSINDIASWLSNMNIEGI